MTREQKLELAAFNEVVAGLCSGIPCTNCPFDDGDVCKMQQWVKQMSIEALQAQAEKTCNIEKSNFSKEQYKLDIDTAYECGYNAGLQAQGEQLISKRAVLDAMNFEDIWLADAKSHNSNTKIAFSGIYHSINKLPTWVEAEVVIEHSGFLKYIAENMNPNEYQKYYNQYYHTTDEKVGGQDG